LAASAAGTEPSRSGRPPTVTLPVASGTSPAIARTTAAENLGLQGEVEWNPLDGAVAVRLERTGGAALPDSVRLTVSHATRAGHDQIVTLASKGDGRYAGRVDPLGPGRWQIMIEDTAGQWRVKGGLQAPQERTARLAP